MHSCLYKQYTLILISLIDCLLEDAFDLQYLLLFTSAGHEASFTLFLCCLFKLRVFQEKDCAALVCRVFTRYLSYRRHHRRSGAGKHVFFISLGRSWGLFNCASFLRMYSMPLSSYLGSFYTTQYR